MSKRIIAATSPGEIAERGHSIPGTRPTTAWQLTRALVQAGKLLDVDVLDHLIIGQGRFVSLKERGLGFALTKTDMA